MEAAARRRAAQVGDEAGDRGQLPAARNSAAPAATSTVSWWVSAVIPRHTSTV